MKAIKSNRGWSLVEGMSVLAILAILSSSAWPSVRELAESARRDAIAAETLAALRLARSEAIERGDQVVLCKTNAGGTCSNSGGWDQGWVAFHDRNGNAEVDEGEEVVLRQGSLPTGWRLTGNGPLSRYVAYQSLGQTRLSSGGFQAGTFTLCKATSGPTTAVRIVINSMGRPRAEKVAVASC
jgi:type IV fimbrial biogenesis protein FimT